MMGTMMPRFVAEALHDKNEAFAELEAMTRKVERWRTGHNGPAGYEALPDGWEDERRRLEDQYRRAQRRYRFALGRR